MGAGHGPRTIAMPRLPLVKAVLLDQSALGGALLRNRRKSRGIDAFRWAEA